MMTVDTIANYLNKKYLEWQQTTGKRTTVREWSKVLDVSYTSLIGWMNGVHPPSTDNLKRLENARDGAGEPLFGHELLDMAASFDNPLDEESQRLLDLMHSIPAERRGELLGLVEDYLTANGWRRVK